MHVNGDPRLLRARAIPATECSRGAAASVLLIFRDFSQKMSLARFGLECSSLLLLLRLDLARGAAGSKLPAKESGSKLPHSKKDVKIYGTNSASPLASTKVSEKRTQNELEKRVEDTQKTQNEPEN